jgi:hypothetical protein
MSGKDLLAVLAMTVPSFLLIALIAISLVPPANFAETRPGSGYERNNAQKDARSQSGAKRARAAGDPSARVRRDIEAQDMISDFWGRPYCANCVQVSQPARCNSSAQDDGRSC